MEIVDVNVSKLDKYNMEDELYYESLWEKMFDDGEYTDDGCNEAVGFIYSNACHAEVYDNAMCVRWIKDCANKLRLAMVANDLVNNLMGTEKKEDHHRGEQRNHASYWRWCVSQHLRQFRDASHTDSRLPGSLKSPLRRVQCLTN